MLRKEILSFNKINCYVLKINVNVKKKEINQINCYVLKIKKKWK